MFDALVHRQDRNVASPRKPAGVEQRLQADHHARGTIGRAKDALDEIRARQVQRLPGDSPALMREQARVVSKDGFDAAERSAGRADVSYWSHCAPRFSI